MHVYMYACMHVCSYVCMCVYDCMSICVYAYFYVDMRAHAGKVHRCVVHQVEG